VFTKDLRLELRNRYALNAILMFAVTTLAVVSFALGQSGLSPKLLGAVFWIIMFFSAISALAHVFIREEESGTALALRLTSDPEAVFIGKLLYNFSLLALLGIVLTPLFFVFTDVPNSGAIPFLPVLVLGLCALGAATTLVAAIIARAACRGALFAVLAFPVLIPLLLTVVGASEKALGNRGLATYLPELQVMLAYTVVAVVGSLLLFRFVWRD
jgi:heme exporter protein B